MQQILMSIKKRRTSMHLMSPADRG